MDGTPLPDLLRRHAGLVHRIAYGYCRNPTDREEVVQEALLQLWRSRDRYDGTSKEATWVYRIALNVAISFHRRERHHNERRHPEDVGAITIAAAPPADPGEDVERLLSCIDDLGELDRALVLLHLEGNDHATIAEVLGISVSNVGTKLQRIRTALRAALERRARSIREEDSHAAR